MTQNIDDECKLKAWAHDTPNQWESKDSQEPRPNSFHVTYALSVEVVASSTFSLDHGLEAL